MTPTLRPFQEDGKLDIQIAFDLLVDRVLYVLPTGGGKTYTFVSIAADQPGIVWVVAHRQELIKQASKTLTRFGIDHGVVKSGYPFQPEKRFQVASMQTLVRRAATMPAPSLIVLDESHHALCNSILKILATAPRSRVLGVTATPCRLNGEGLGAVFQKMILGPTNKWLTEQGYLSPVQYYGPPPQVDVSTLPIRGGDYAKEASAKAMDKAVVTGDAIEHYKRVCNGVSMIVFCVSVDHAKHVAKEYCDAGYRATSVDGTLTDEEREDRLGGLEIGKYHIVTTCELIGEGLDIPNVVAIQLLRPTTSLGFHLQSLGRPLRPVYAEGADLSTQEGRLRGIAEGPKPTAFVLDHVGNVVKHRFASTEHQWTLDGKVKPVKEKPEVIRTCGECFRAHETAKTCPYCGFVYPVKSRSLTKMEIVDGKLVRLEETPEARAEEMRAARSMPELIAFAKARGYKKPAWWARKVYHGRSYAHLMPKL